MQNKQEQNEPFIIHFILKPDPEVDFIKRLIEAYSQKLSKQHPQLCTQFQEKQQKLLRHKQKLRQISQMSEDQTLRDKILEQIQIKQYQKLYQKSLNSSNIPAWPYKSEGKQNKTFHFTTRTVKGRQSQQNSSQIMNNIQIQKIGKQQNQKKFRSSLIKKSSFSGIKNKISSSQNKTFVMGEITNLRDSQDTIKDDHNIFTKSQKSQMELKIHFESDFFIKNKKQKIKNRLMGRSDANMTLNESCDGKPIKVYKNSIVDKQTENLQFGQNRNTEDFNKKHVIQKNQVNNCSPYDVKNFISQLNSFHYKSIYSDLKKKQTSRKNNFVQSSSTRWKSIDKNG